MRRLILAGMLTALLFAPAGAGVDGTGTASAATSAPDVCANRLCTIDRPGTQGCRELFRGYERVARCFVNRAAVHFRQSRSLAQYVAHRESRYEWWVTNAYGYAGLYQFGTRLWSTTPYRRYSRLQPRWASLAAMHTWSRGGYRHWASG